MNNDEFNECCTGSRIHNKQIDIDAEDFRFTHDDSVESLFTPVALGKISFHSGWDLANIFRYATVANAIVKIKRESVEQVVDILDIGSSAANLYTFWLSSYANPGRPRVNYVGLEVRDEPIACANKMYAERNKKYVNKAQVIKHDIIQNRITELNSKYDVIAMQEVLEHVPRDVCKRTIADAVNCLKPGGTIIISSPNPKKHEGQYFVWEDSHVYEYALWEMLEEIKNAGLIAVEIKGWLGKSRYIKPRLSKSEMDLYDDLSPISAGLAAAIIAYTKPEVAQCFTIVAKRPSELKKRDLDWIHAKYDKYYEPLPFAPEIKE